MTIGEALAASKIDGKTYDRGGCWIRYDPDWVYKLDGEDLMADDWVAVGSPEDEL